MTGPLLSLHIQKLLHQLLLLSALRFKSLLLLLEFLFALRTLRFDFLHLLRTVPLEQADAVKTLDDYKQQEGQEDA